MSMRNSRTLVMLLLLLVASRLSLPITAAQQAQPKSQSGQPGPPAGNSPKAPSAAKASKAAGGADAAKKAEILNSQRWQQALFGMNEWLSAQPYYDPKQIEALKAEVRARVEKMSATELQFFLEDMEAKLKLLNTAQAQETQAWAARYLDLLTDKARAKMLKDMPNIATMTAAQVQQALLKIQLRRQNLELDQAEYNRSSVPPINPWTNTNNRSEQEQYVRNHSADVSSYVSPFRTQPAVRPFDNVESGPDLGYWINPYGGVGLTYSPNRW
jgi:hypothetical protein